MAGMSPLPDSERKAWEQWRIDLPGIEELSVRRCYKSSDTAIVDVSLHCYSDASNIGYGQVAYLRHVHVNGEIDVSVVVAKSRVTPPKVTTMPRLQLVAATVSVKVGALLKTELRKDMRTTYWTDSKIVLGYINNCKTRFRVFVANRLQKIHLYTKPYEWQYVSSNENPADYTSRGITARERQKVDVWLNGPPYLYREIDGCSKEMVYHIKENDPEVKVSKQVYASKVSETNDILGHLEEQISSWNKMKRVLAWVLRFVKGCRTNISEDKCLTVEEILQAELRNVKQVQAGDDNCKEASRCGIKAKKGGLGKLDPYVDNDGILKVGGRLNNSPLDVSKNPVILPRKGIISLRIVEHYHKIVQHGGRTTTVSEIRSAGY